MEALYASFDVNQTAVEEMRMSEYPQLEKLQKEYNSIKKELKDSNHNQSSKLELFKKQLELEEKLKKMQAKDQMLIDLKTLIAKEKDIFQTIGNDMISSNVEQEIWQNFLKIVYLSNSLFILKHNQLVIEGDQKKINEFKSREKEIVTILDSLEANTIKEINIIQGKFPSPEREEELKSLQAKLATSNKIKNRLLSGIQKDLSLKIQEKDLLEHFERENKEKTENLIKSDK